MYHLDLLNEISPFFIGLNVRRLVDAKDQDAEAVGQAEESFEHVVFKVDVGVLFADDHLLLGVYHDVYFWDLSDQKVQQDDKVDHLIWQPDNPNYVNNYSVLSLLNLIHFIYPFDPFIIIRKGNITYRVAICLQH